MNIQTSEAIKRRFAPMLLFISIGILVNVVTVMLFLTAHRVFSVTTQPIAKLQSISGTFDNLHPIDFTRVVFAHYGDFIPINRTVFSNVTGTIYLEREFNNANSRKVTAPKIVTQHFEYGMNVMSPIVTITADMPVYTPLHYEVIAFDFKHAPALLSDFTICIFPKNDPLPTVREICATPAEREKWLESLTNP